MRPLLALTLLASLAPAAPVPKAVKKDDAARIVGSWKPTDKGTCHYEFKADGTMRTWHTPEVGKPIDWTWTLDPEATPKRLKLTYVASKQSYDCVYSLDGDRLKLAFTLGVKQLHEKWEETPGIQLYDQTRDTSGK
jgi:uncharacterized protein (TIGR03067 family)